MKLSDFRPETIRTLLADLQGEATGFVRSCDAKAQILSEYKIYMRYTGQGWEIPIVLTAAQAKDPDAQTILDLFEAEYTKLFGRTVAGLDVEITVWSVNATTPVGKVAPVRSVTVAGPADVAGQRQIFEPALSAFQQAQVVRRTAMTAGQTAEGPAAITEDETTIIIPASRRALRQSDGCIDILKKG